VPNIQIKFVFVNKVNCAELVDNRKMIEELVKRLRRERKLTQKQLGEAIGVTQQDISGLERGAVEQPRYLKDLADYFGMSLDRFYREAGLSGKSPQEDERLKYMQQLSDISLRLSLERLRIAVDVVSSLANKDEQNE
jgi:transcriptional regulator with XRE-family HTH domain